MQEQKHSHTGTVIPIGSLKFEKVPFSCPASVIRITKTITAGLKLNNAEECLPMSVRNEKKGSARVEL